MLGLLAAAAHDVDHPGVNQPFLIKTKHHLASLYQVRMYLCLKSYTSAILDFYYSLAAFYIAALQLQH